MLMVYIVSPFPLPRWGSVPLQYPYSLRIASVRLFYTWAKGVVATRTINAL